MIKKAKSISVIIPVRNEVQNITKLFTEIEQSLRGHVWELIWIDDASTDNTWDSICALPAKNVKGISLKKRIGQSSAIWLGILHSSGQIIVTMDGDLQNDPADIPMLLSGLGKNVDLVQGYRRSRHDSFFKRVLPSKIANYLSRTILKIPVIDLGCTLRVFRRELTEGTPIIGDMHRILCLYLIKNGARYAQLPVNHRPRKFGTSKYGISRAWKFPLDILLFSTLSELFARPLYLFARLAFGVSIVGILSIVSAIVLRIISWKDFIDGTLILGGLILCSMSVMLIGVGLVAEMLARQTAHQNPEAMFRLKDSLRV